MMLKRGNCELRYIEKSLTFIELLIVVVIISVLIGITLPKFRNTFNNLQFNNAAQELQSFMNYLRERSIVEGKIIYLNIDNEQKKYWALINNTENRLETYRFPAGINLETSKTEIAFYPDGSIDKTDIKLMMLDKQQINLTTKGVFGGVRLRPE